MRNSNSVRRSIIGCVALLLATSLYGEPGNDDDPVELSPQEIVQIAGDSVVLIEVQGNAGSTQGTGFLVNSNGSIATCLHVIDGATSIVVSLRDGTRVEEVAVRAFDVQSDLALLAVDLPRDDSSWAVVELGDSEAIEPGAPILVISNPMGLEHTATEGIVSAWRKPEDSELQKPCGESPLKLALPQGGALQISATISPGSSGAPVLNDRAEAIGVATSGVLWGMAGLNFAVPIDKLVVLLEQDDAMDLDSFGERVDDVRRDLARPHFEDSDLAYQGGEIVEARQCLERALHLYPRYEEALLLAGRIGIEIGQFDLAEQRLSFATALDEYNADAWYYLGDVQQKKAIASNDRARLSRAEVAFEKALAIDPWHGKAAYRLALFQISRGQFERAKQLLILATDSEPGFADAYYMLGEIHHDQGRLDDSKEAFNQALREDESHAMSHLGLALLYLDIERRPNGTVEPYGRASSHLEEFLRLSENDPALAADRELAARFIREYFPHILD